MWRGDGGICIWDPKDAAQGFGEYIYARLLRSSLSSGTYINGYYKDAKGDYYIKSNADRVLGDSLTKDDALFIAPFCLDPNNSSRLLVGGKSLWLTSNPRDETDPNKPNDTVPIWTKLREGVGDPSRQPRISGIFVDLHDSNSIWLGYETGELYHTSNGLNLHPTWDGPKSSGSQTAPLPSRYVTRVVFDPSEPKTIYLTYGGYPSSPSTFVTDNIWKSVDGGLTWAPKAKNLPWAPVRSLVIHPRNHLWIYAGTAVGLFSSDDGGEHWALSNQGPVQCPIDDLFWRGSTLIAATHGRGMWMIDIPLQ